MIGDKDPEDAYDAGDPPSVRIDVLERVVDDLRDGPDDDRHRHRIDDALRLVDGLERVRGADRHRVDAVRAALEEL